MYMTWVFYVGDEINLKENAVSFLDIYVHFLFVSLFILNNTGLTVADLVFPWYVAMGM